MDGKEVTNSTQAFVLLGVEDTVEQLVRSPQW